MTAKIGVTFTTIRGKKKFHLFVKALGLRDVDPVGGGNLVQPVFQQIFVLVLNTAASATSSILQGGFYIYLPRESSLDALMLGSFRSMSNMSWTTSDIGGLNSGSDCNMQSM